MLRHRSVETVPVRLHLDDGETVRVEVELVETVEFDLSFGGTGGVGFGFYLALEGAVGVANFLPCFFSFGVAGGDLVGGGVWWWFDGGGRWGVGGGIDVGYFIGVS